MALPTLLADLSFRKGAPNASVKIIGTTTEGDAPERHFIWNDESLLTADGIDVISVTGVIIGRWIQIPAGGTPKETYYDFATGEDTVEVSDDPEVSISGLHPVEAFLYTYDPVLDAFGTQTPIIIDAGMPIEGQVLINTSDSIITLPTQSSDEVILGYSRRLKLISYTIAGNPLGNGTVIALLGQKASITYVDAQDLVLANLITVLKGGSSETIANLKASIDALNAIVGSVSPDGDSFVDTVTELLAVFSSFPEGVDIVTLIGTKVNISDVVNTLTEVVSGKVLDARQGKVLKDLVDLLITDNQAQDSAIAGKVDIGDVDAKLVLTLSDFTGGVTYNNPALASKVVNVDYFPKYFLSGQYATDAVNEGTGGFTLPYAVDALDKIIIEGSVSKQPTNKIAPHTASAYQIGDQVNKFGEIWEANAVTLSTDIPGTSIKWTNITHRLFGPYASLALANAAVPIGMRLGRIVGITTVDSIVEYTWQADDLSDAGIIEKNYNLVKNAEIMVFRNLFNPNEITTGFYLQSSNGLPFANAQSAYSGYVPVLGGEYYTLSGVPSLSDPATNVVVFYDEDKTQISRVSGTLNYTHLTPINAKYVRFNVRWFSVTADYNSTMYNKGEEISTPYVAYGVSSGVFDVEKIIGDFDLRGVYDLARASDFMKVPNLFDISLVTTGSFLHSGTGSATGLALCAFSGYTPVEGGEYYTLSGVPSLNPSTANVIVFYDEDKVKLSWVSNVGNFTHSTPLDARFVRFNVRYNSDTADYSATMYNKGAEAFTPYFPYGAASNVYDIEKIIGDFDLVGTYGLAKSSDFMIGRNLFDPNEITNGYYLASNNGLPFSSSTSAYSDYVPVLENTYYTLSGAVSLASQGANVVVFYDEDKNIISWVNNVDNFTHLTPSGTKFVRFNVRWSSAIADYSTTMYNKGASVSTPYVAFGVADVFDVEKILTGFDLASFLNLDQYATDEDLDNIGVVEGVNDPNIAPLTDIYMIPCYGQSLSINTNAGASTFTSAVPIAYTTSLVNSNIQDMNGGYAEMFLALSKEFKPLPSTFKMMTCLGGAGGKSVLQLSKGTAYYNTLIANITSGFNIAVANGLTYNVPAFCWTQGEEDMRAGGVPSSYGSGSFNPLVYATKLTQLINDLNTDIKAITGQTNNVKCIMYQVASHNPYFRYPRIAMEQLKLATTDERVVLAKTMYEADYDATDQVHAPAKTYRNMGNHYGIALHETIVQKKRVLPIFPVSNFFIGTDLYVRFHVPVTPLVFDTTIVSALADGNYGFNLYTVTNETSGTSGTIALAAQTITAVVLFSSDTVKISLSALPPAGTRLTYGVNGDFWNYIGGTGVGSPKSGRTDGARGNLRDSRTYLNQVSNYFTLYNWCPIFEIIL